MITREVSTPTHHSESNRRRAFNEAMRDSRKTVTRRFLGWLMWFGIGAVMVWLLDVMNVHASFHISFLIVFILSAFDWNFGYTIKNAFEDALTDYFVHEQMKDSLTDLVSDIRVTSELKDIIASSVKDALSDSALDRNSRNFELKQIESRLAGLQSELTRMSNEISESNKTFNDIADSL